MAFIDERILKSNWLGRAEWMKNPLQLELFGEYTAGENFFTRMRALLNRREWSASLEVYYLCLGLGFHGGDARRGGRCRTRSRTWRPYACAWPRCLRERRLALTPFQRITTPS